MRHLARRILRVFMVAVALSASSLNGYAAVLAAFDVHAHGHHGMHSHPSHDHDAGLHADHAIGDEDPASSDQPCKHLHMHCCSSVAVAAADYALTETAYTRAVVPIANSHIPHGQIASRLYRPPRAVA
jgi:hypothetical protein